MAKPTYRRVDWKDYPEISTPLTAANLNKMDKAISDIVDFNLLGWVGQNESYPYHKEVLVGYGGDQKATGSGLTIYELASITDYGNSIIESTDPDNFTIDYQHTIRIGKIVFVHFTFTLASQIDSAIYTFAKIKDEYENLLPNHDHGITICGYNDSMTGSSALRTDSAVIKTDGTILFRAVASGTSSNFSYDVACFYSLTDLAFNDLIFN